VECGVGDNDNKRLIFAHRFRIGDTLKTNLLTLAAVLVALPLLMAHFWGYPWTPMRIAGGDRPAVFGVPDLGTNPAWRIVFGSCQGAGARHPWPVFANAKSDLRFRCLYHRGMFPFRGFAETSLGVCGAHPPADLPCKEGREVLAAKFGDEYRAYKAGTWF
jgi:hypothetical protein